MSSDSKEKHTKSKAHQRDKKEEKKKNGGKAAKAAAATPVPAEKPAQ